MSLADDLAKLGELKASGVLSDTEFAQAKARALGGAQTSREGRTSTEDKPVKKKVSGGNILLALIIFAALGFAGFKFYATQKWEKQEAAYKQLTSSMALFDQIQAAMEEPGYKLTCLYVGALAFQISEAREAGISKRFYGEKMQKSPFIGRKDQPNANLAQAMFSAIYQESDGPGVTRDRYAQDCKAYIPR